jgi:glycosyltransferase involved in cell wall biosynthesis
MDLTPRFVILAPTYNNARTLGDVIERLLRGPVPVIVVNDGATDATAEVLAGLAARTPEDRLIIITHPQNQGKAAALRTGFAAAGECGFTHAVTIDTDGQHDPAHIPALLEAAVVDSSALVLGVRAERTTASPSLNKLGWWMSALGIWLETGVRVLDSQCGLRVYPLELVRRVRCLAARFGYEAEIITRAVWAGFAIVEVPVTCHYFEGDRRVSHFRPWRDGVQGFLMHAGLTILRLVPWPRWRRPLAPAEHAAARAGAVGNGLARLKPAALWDKLREDRFEQLLVAAGLGIGTFMVAIPLGGWQILLAVYVAIRLRVHWIATTLGSLLCISPLGEPLARLVLRVGYGLTHFRLPDEALLAAATAGPLAAFGHAPASAMVGGVVVGFVLNWITIPVFVRVFRLIPVRREAAPARSGPV